MKKKCSHYDLALVQPDFNSNITDLILDLNHLKKKKLGGSTHPEIFFQLKHIFHLMESIGSARIEGNRTTIAELVEAKLYPQDPYSQDENIKEILNLEKAIDFIDNTIQDYPINRMFISELHKLVVDGLSPEKEGVLEPGLYRTHNVRITNTDHCPPDVCSIAQYMDELYNFINTNHPERYDLIKVAIAHHRFAWIHPFSNGNGRTVRLLTYSMLVKQGFNVKEGRILNPTAIFCCDRKEYYNHLSLADNGAPAGILQWCEYVLKGLQKEIYKIDKLLNYDILKKDILHPALAHALKQEWVTSNECDILRVAIDKQIFQAKDIKKIMPTKGADDISRRLRRLKDKRMINSPEGKKQDYFPNFSSNHLLRAVVGELGKQGFLPFKD